MSTPYRPPQPLRLVANDDGSFYLLLGKRRLRVGDIVEIPQGRPVGRGRTWVKARFDFDEHGLRPRFTVEHGDGPHSYPCAYTGSEHYRARWPQAAA